MTLYRKEKKKKVPLPDLERNNTNFLTPVSVEFMANPSPLIQPRVVFSQINFIEKLRCINIRLSS